VLNYQFTVGSPQLAVSSQQLVVKL